MSRRSSDLFWPLSQYMFIYVDGVSVSFTRLHPVPKIFCGASSSHTVSNQKTDPETSKNPRLGASPHPAIAPHGLQIAADARAVHAPTSRRDGRLRPGLDRAGSRCNPEQEMQLHADLNPA